jgi:hypothetical protein
MSRNLTIEQITTILQEIEAKGFIQIPAAKASRSDEGAIGQVLENEFGILENNFAERDLGTFELKGFRKRSSSLTLFHKKPETGLTPIQLFDRFGYLKASLRDSSVLKKKLFCTITGINPNPLGLLLKAKGDNEIDLYYGQELLSSWCVKGGLLKADEVIMVFAETRGMVNTPNEEFHFIEAYRCSGLRNLSDLINEGAIVIDFCIDQVVGSSKRPHDRGPHIRLVKNKLSKAYKSFIRIL